jgi:hypothetical protein
VGAVVATDTCCAAAISGPAAVAGEPPIRNPTTMTPDRVIAVAGRVTRNRMNNFDSFTCNSPGKQQQWQAVTRSVARVHEETYE